MRSDQGKESSRGGERATAMTPRYYLGMSESSSRGVAREAGVDVAREADVEVASQTYQNRQDSG